MIRMGVPTQVDSGRAGGCKFLGSGLWGRGGLVDGNRNRQREGVTRAVGETGIRGAPP